MSTPSRDEVDQWWKALPRETRDNLDGIARKSVLGGLVGFPYWNLPLCAELRAWQDLEAEVLEAHGLWLAKLKHHAESRGREWNRVEFLRICHLELVDE